MPVQRYRGEITARRHLVTEIALRGVCLTSPQVLVLAQFICIDPL